MNIRSKVLAFINKPQPELFSSVAIDSFRHQYSSVASYRKYCDLRGVGLDQTASLDEIPLVSTLAFKHCDLSEDGGCPDEQLTFLTSGTTRGQERRGRHRVPHPEIYRASAIANLRTMMFPNGARMRMLAVHPTADRMPESSLSAMITWCIEEFGSGETLCATDRKGLNVAEAVVFLRRAERDDSPVCILGTTAAAAAIFEELGRHGEKIELPRESRMMDTGGPKGQVVPLSSHELIDLAEERLGLDPDHVINEYGMTELCSQLYDATALNSDARPRESARIKIAPPWMRPMAIDPATQRRLPDGAEGMLGFIDLANICSVSAILTEDMGVVEGDRVRILGRAVAGGPRGCALSIAQFAGDRSKSTRAVKTRTDQTPNHGALELLELHEHAAALRSSLSDRLSPDEIARGLGEALERWRDRAFVRRRQTVARVSSELGFSQALVDESLDALLRPFTRNALAEAAAGVSEGSELLGFIMPGNVIGAGLHEIVLALIAGRALMLKTAAREPLFLVQFAETIAEILPALGRRIAVRTWPRERTDLTLALQKEIDCLVAYGDDATIQSLEHSSQVIGFGSRLSGAVVMRGAGTDSTLDEVARGLALDVCLFEQLGCLSPHHLFVECNSDTVAESFAERMARELHLLCQRLPPPLNLALEDGAALRSFRESALWRSLAGEPVRLIQPTSLGASVVFDANAQMTASPGLRCVYVSAIRDDADLQDRLVPAHGKLEAFAIAGDQSRSSGVRDILLESGVSYLATPGVMQSPPLNWRHGGGAFLDRMMGG